MPLDLETMPTDALRHLHHIAECELRTREMIDDEHAEGRDEPDDPDWRHNMETDR